MTHKDGITDKWLADLGKLVLEAATDDSVEITVHDESDHPVLQGHDEAIEGEIADVLEALQNADALPKSVEHNLNLHDECQYCQEETDQ